MKILKDILTQQVREGNTSVDVICDRLTNSTICYCNCTFYFEISFIRLHLNIDYLSKINFSLCNVIISEIRAMPGPL